MCTHESFTIRSGTYYMNIFWLFIHIVLNPCAVILLFVSHRKKMTAVGFETTWKRVNNYQIRFLFVWTVALRNETGPRWAHVVFMSRCVTDQIESIRWRGRTALMDGLTLRCSEENVPVSSPNVRAFTNFRDCVACAVIDRLSRPLHLLFYGWPSERSRPLWNTVSQDLCPDAANLS